MIEDFKQQEEKDLYKSLLALKIFNMSQQKPFILRLFKTLQEKKVKLYQVRDILAFLEKFHFCFNAVCSMRPSGIDKSYYTAAIQLLKTTNKRDCQAVLDELKERLKVRIPAKGTFIKNFSELRYTKNKKLIQYIFSYVESLKQTTNEFKPDNMTLEHILPQSSNAEFVDFVGNLLPLAGELNRKGGDKDFLEKIEIYKQSNFALTQEFAQSDPQKWGKEEIKKRTNYLAEYCYDSMWNNSNP